MIFIISQGKNGRQLRVKYYSLASRNSNSPAHDPRPLPDVTEPRFLSSPNFPLPSDFARTTSAAVKITNFKSLKPEAEDWALQIESGS